MKRVVALKSKSYEHRILICELLSKLGEADRLDAQGGLRETARSRAVTREPEDIMATIDCISKIQLSIKDGKQDTVLDCTKISSSYCLRTRTKSEIFNARKTCKKTYG